MNISRRALLATCGAATTAALAGCSASAPAPGGEWPQRGVDSARTGYADVDAPTGSLYQFWEREHPGRGTASPVVGDGRVYLVSAETAIGDETGYTTLAAFEGDSGDRLWDVDLYETETETAATPYHTDSLVLHGDRVFVQTNAGLQTVGTDGEPRWTFPNVGEAGLLNWSFGPPVVTDDVVVTSAQGSLVDGPATVSGLDPAEGEEVWRAEFPELSGIGYFAAADGVVYASAVPDAVVALDLATGDELWRRELPIAGRMAVADDRLIVGLLGEDDETDHVAALDEANGETLWRRQSGFLWPANGFSVAGDHCYHVAARGTVARRLDTGEPAWRFPRLGDPVRHAHFGTTPVVARDAVYVTGTEGVEDTEDVLFVLDRENGELLASHTLEDGVHDEVVPVVTSELVYVTLNGGVAAVGECGTEILGRCVSR